MGRNEINDYVIYKIVCLSNPELVYVGTTANFYNRRTRHRQSCNNPNGKGYNQKIYVIIRENGGWDNFNMIIIDECKQITLTKSRQLEEEWRIKLNANLNSYKCFQTKEDFLELYKKKYYENNKEVISEKSKIYYENNKEKINKKNEKYYQNNKEFLSEKSKIYHENNKEVISEKKKIYRENNKGKLSEKRKEKITCECGSIIVKSFLARHKLTPKHICLCRI